MNKIEKLAGKKLPINFLGTRYNLIIRVEKYISTGQPAIEFYEENGDPFGRLTICLSGISLKENEIIIKNWSENEELAINTFASGLFKNTGKKVQTGFVFAPIWEVL